MSKLTFAATGDSFMTRPVPEGGYPGLEDIRSIIASCDVRFNNLEFTAHDMEGTPASASGGTWAMSEPEILDELKSFGFNVYNFANNHTLDYGEDGLLATIRHLDERGMANFGAGKDLRAASAPLYLEFNGQTVAFIGVSASMNAFNPAADPTPDMKGRPGLNPLRHSTEIHVTPDKMALLREIADETDLNAERSYSISNGYIAPDKPGRFSFGGISFVEDSSCFKKTISNARDLARTLDGIREAREKADYVVISVHAHGFDGKINTVPSEFVTEFCRACVDGGADIIFGHGPHELRGLEIYKGKPIFYSLGNFIFQTETVKLQPAEAYQNMGLPLTSCVKDLMDLRNNHGTTGYLAIKPIWISVIACVTAEDGKITGIRLHPIWLDGIGNPYDKIGWPHLSGDDSTLRYFEELSRPYGTEFIYDGAAAEVKL